jgi:hypothetical protein
MQEGQAMSELDDWAAETGYKPGNKGSDVDTWFNQHPDRFAQLGEARQRGWSWRRICQFLAERAGFPFTSTPLTEYAHRQGIL